MREFKNFMKPNNQNKWICSECVEDDMLTEEHRHNIENNTSPNTKTKS